ncbi:integrase core domain-containing protein, partial [Proteiniphilum sp. X52]|uniref:integrase core domain-containing protein n=1 Tax=Proteiniphilum sp. X52 TaxID=2382159 RepID=UPI000F4196F1
HGPPSEHRQAAQRRRAHRPPLPAQGLRVDRVNQVWAMELYQKIKDYMEFYNRKRPHQTLGYKTPEEMFRETNLSDSNNCLRKGRSLAKCKFAPLYSKINIMNRLNDFILFFLFGLCIISCKNSSKQQFQNLKADRLDNIDTTLICYLEENIDVIQNIDDAKFLNDSIFIVITNKQLIKYNILGKQIQLFGSKGIAPYEYITPSLIDVNDSSIYVWCNTSMKLIEYDHYGNYKGVITNYKEAIKNFKVYQDKYIFFYKNNGIKQGIIDVYDIKKNEKIKSVGIFG